jgi:hypothetical protein
MRLLRVPLGREGIEAEMSWHTDAIADIENGPDMAISELVDAQ